ncbi:uncharacterized protein B0H64DRAFT_422437 [Chaetomium fimeti]|uniref:Uncharacterized protein n=1 Tax=Chaetomium fimeti TaxID=1854472 RepID=A0AAE0HLE3_9PEZI|nr:hypothetical protein B0H64DRAFT_422437 [Chaetomium fimeti]
MKAPAVFGSTQSSPLFRLTPLLRRHIYRLVGLESCDSDDPPFGFDLHIGKASYDAPAASNFHGLLLSCRDLYTEAAALLYSANRFFIYYTRPGSLGPLRSLTAPSLASLTHLKIVLNQSSCHHPDSVLVDCGFCCLHGRLSSGANECEEEHGGRHRPPLLSGSDDDGLARLRVQGMLNEWHSTTAHLSAHITSRLELSLVCDLDPQNGHALEVAESITAPLHGLSTSLRNCHVRLSKAVDSRLQEVARDAVMQARGIETPYLKPSQTATATSLMDLPRELRLHILEYTDLIVPWREVTWSRQNPGYMVLPGENGPDLLSWNDFTPSLFNCWEIKNAHPPVSVGCFCRRYHSAFSSDCRCWVPPSSLFLVCRALYQDALFVFFSANELFVHDLCSDPPWWASDLPEPEQRPGYLEPKPWRDYPHERFAASLFLREVVPVCALAHLRFLELVFPPYLGPSWPQAGQPAMQDWWATVDWLRDKINAPRLTLRLIGTDPPSGSRVAYLATGPYRVTITVAEGDAIMQSYMDILRPLRKLAEGGNGLARVHVNFRYPWQYTEASRSREEDVDYRCWLDDRRRETNDRLERYVMGDRYGSLCENNQEDLPSSRWLSRFYGH